LASTVRITRRPPIIHGTLILVGDRDHTETCADILSTALQMNIRAVSTLNDKALEEILGATIVILLLSRPIDPQTIFGLEDRLRAAGGCLLPVFWMSDILLVGPLCGASRSCVRCWVARCAEHGRTMVRESGSAGVDDVVASEVVSEGALVLAGRLAVQLLSRGDRPSTSSYFEYVVSTGSLRRGVLTSRNECPICSSDPVAAGFGYEEIALIAEMIKTTR
jgi:hypothetical protein